MKHSNSYSLNRSASILPRMALLRQHASSAPGQPGRRGIGSGLSSGPRAFRATCGYVLLIPVGGILHGLEECAREGCCRVFISFSRPRLRTDFRAKLFGGQTTTWRARGQARSCRGKELSWERPIISSGPAKTSILRTVLPNLN